MAVHPPGWSQGSWNTFFLSLTGTERSNVLAAHIREFCLLFLFRSSSEATSEGRECAHLSAKLNSSCPSWHSPGSQKCCKQRLLFTEWGLCVFSSLLLTSSCGPSASLTAQPKRGSSESEPSRYAPSNEQGLEEYFSWCRVSLPSDLPCIQKPTVIYGMQEWRHGEHNTKRQIFIPYPPLFTQRLTIEETWLLICQVLIKKYLWLYRHTQPRPLYPFCI